MFDSITYVNSYNVAYIKEGTIHSKLFMKNEFDQMNDACRKLDKLHVKFAVYSIGDNDVNCEYFGAGKAIKLSDVTERCRNKIQKFLEQRDMPIYFIEDFGDFYRVVIAVERPRFYLLSKKDDTECGNYLVCNRD